MAWGRFLIPCSVSFMAGIFVASLWNDSRVLIPALFILFFIFTLFLKDGRVFLIVALFFIAGAGRIYFFEENFRKSHIYEFLEEEIYFTARVVNEPDVREKNTRLVVGDLNINGTIFRKERIIIFTDSHFSSGYLDVLKIKGKIQKPEPFEEFDYASYLKKDGIYAVIYYPQIEVMEEGKSLIFSLKEEAREILYKNISFPRSVILGAMVLGDKGRVPDHWLKKLNISGARHITAVSGMHIVILTSIIALILSGLDKKISFPVIGLFLFFFISLTGFQASAIRAGIISLLAFLAGTLGREYFPLRAAFLVAFLMLMANPMLLIFDIGFQLSFLAFGGIIIFSKRMGEILPQLPFKISSVMAITLSAFVFTLPLSLYHFGRFSTVFLPANIALSFLVYPIMFLAPAFLASSFIFQPLSYLFLFPLRFLLYLFTKTIDFFSGISGALSGPIDIGPIELAFLYISLSFFCFISGKMARNRIEL